MNASEHTSLNLFDFELPAAQIAQHAVRRGSSRLLVLPAGEVSGVHSVFRDLPHWMSPGDCLVVNDSRVLPARLWATKSDTGGKVELLLHREIQPARWEALARPYRRLRPGTELSLGPAHARVEGLLGEGRITLAFASPQAARLAIRRSGTVPLPPYIRRTFRTPGPAEKQDRRRYQTIFARTEGSVAAPTAGLHFSNGMIGSLRTRGVRVVPVTLHVGWGTFTPLTEAAWASRRLHPERYQVTQETVDLIADCRRRGNRVIACGTTVARTLESASNGAGQVRAGEGETELFIQPGYRWRTVDGLLTNFHLPRSSLLVLVCALAGRERILAAYAEAVRQGYRFYSYGDAMLVFRSGKA
jgi:S-adenosylmethionine:tRNA ribosyltransferase-isomerase